MARPKIDPDLIPTLDEIRKERAERHLRDYIRYAWPVLEPGTVFVPNWHIDALCDHLEAVTAGEIPRLLVNFPPGVMKSLGVMVFWPSWEWGPRNMPHLRILGTSYAETYAIRDNARMRNLVMSDWYQRQWGDRVALTKWGERKFENTRRGWREGAPFGSLTGGRGDRVLIDDPHSTETAESDAERTRSVRIFRESIQTRLNDPRKSAIVVIMQRLHEGDISGEILERDMGYEHLMLPMRFDEKRRCVTSIGFVDPRKRDGELLFPERFPEEVVAKLENDLGEYATAAQLDQSPTPRSGGLFKREWFEIVDAPPAVRASVRGWDLAASETEDAAWTAGVRISKAIDGTFYIEDETRDRGTPGKVRRMIKATATQDGFGTTIDLPQDPGQAGKAQVQSLVKMLAGYTVRYSPESGSKETRAEPLSSQLEAGNVKLVRGDWNRDFIEEFCKFPRGRYCDRVDAAARAFNRVATMDIAAQGAVGAPRVIYG